MENEEQFYSELKNVPDVPDDIYQEVAKKIGQRKSVIRSVWLATACIVLVIGGLNYLQIQNHKDNTITLYAAQELQDIEDYFNYADIEPDSTLYSSNDLEAEDELSAIIDYFIGDNIEQDINMYAIIDNDFL